MVGWSLHHWRLSSLHILASINWLYSASGFAVGALVGMTGVGGGSLMTPLLVLVFGFHPATAVGTDLLYAAATKSVGTLVHGSRRTVDWPIVGRLAAGSLPGAALTLLALRAFGASGGGTSHLITLVLAIALFLTALSLLFRDRLFAWARTRVPQPRQQSVIVMTILTGLVLGVVVSISSVGAGAIGVTALIALYPSMPTVRIVGSDIAHAVPLTLLAGIGHLLVLGTTDFGLLGSLLVGSIPGIVLGSVVATRVPETVIRPLLAGVLVLVGMKLVGVF